MCDPETDFDNSNSQAKMAKINARSEKDLQVYGSKMKCVDQDQILEIYGSFDTHKASNLMIVFEMCDREAPGNQCKTKDEIESWLT